MKKSENPGLALFNLFLGFGCAAFGAWVIATLWAWFLVPAGAPAISVLTAFGIDLIATVLTFSPPRVETDYTAEDITYRLLKWCLLFPGMLLVMGWIAQATFG